jgi:hypothetical protein
VATWEEDKGDEGTGSGVCGANGEAGRLSRAQRRRDGSGRTCDMISPASLPLWSPMPASPCSRFCLFL